MPDNEPLTITMTEQELGKFLDRVDKWNLHVRNLVKDLCDRARLQVNTQEKTPDKAYAFLADQLDYQFGHNRGILQNMIEVTVRGGKVRRFANGDG